VVELTDAKAASEYLRRAAQLIREDPIRRGALLNFPAAGQLVMTGDLHGNAPNFEKLQRFCCLWRCPGRRVILHELIHEDPEFGGYDLSIDLLVRAAAWKCEYPDNVYFLQSNHELSQLRRQEITKGGRPVVQDFERGARYCFGRGADLVLEAADEYMRSLPLAARAANGIFLSHSLPDPYSISTFDPSFLLREPTEQDLEPGGSAYALLWGRFHTPESLDLLAEMLGADLFVVGHTPQDEGYAVIGRMIILASDHQHGTFLPIDLHRRYTIEQLESNIRKFASVE